VDSSKMRQTRPRKPTESERSQLLDLARFAMSANRRQSSRSPFSLRTVCGFLVHILACALCVPLLLCLPVAGQDLPATPTQPAAQPEIPPDPLGRSTPRGTVLGFLLADRSGDDEAATKYLNTRLRGKAATELARQLFLVLDRRLPAKLHALSDKPNGSAADPLKPDQELVGTIKSDNGNVDITLERVSRGRGEPGTIWLFSSETLDAIPALYQEVNVISVEKVLPTSLVSNRLFGIPLFQWLALFIGIPLFFLATELLDRLSGPLIGSWRRQLRKRPDLTDFGILPIPIRFLLLAGIIQWLLNKFSLPLLARQFWSSLASILTIAGCVWLVILVNGRLEKYVGRFLPWRNFS